MAVFDRAIATAERLIDKYGQKVQWKTILSGPADPAEPWKVQVSADVLHDVTICFLPVNKESRQLYTFLTTGKEVAAGSTLGYMKGNLDFAPNPNDVIVRDGSVYKIKNLDLLSPNGQHVLWTMELET